MATSCIENIDIDSIQDLTLKALRKNPQNVPMPCKIELNDYKDPVICEQVVRLVPRKRMLLFATWGKTKVAVKIFYERGRAEKTSLKDVFGINILTKSNVPTPKLLYNGTIDKGRIKILILERLNNCFSMLELYAQRKSIDDIRLALSSLIIELATQHVLGILQRDLHLNNFLISKEKIYTLDGGQIEKFDNPLCKKLSIEYLALFLAQLGVGNDKTVNELFDIYTKSRSWIVKKADIKLFRYHLYQKRQERWKSFQKKIFRDSSAFRAIRKFNKSIVYNRQFESENFLDLLHNPEKYMHSKNAEMMKDGDSTTVIKLNLDGRSYVIKRYNLKHSLHRIRRALRTTRAVKSWMMSNHLYLFGVLTPKPVAFIENNILGVRGRSYFIMEYVKGEDLLSYYSKEQSHTIAKKTVSLFQSLIDLKITHGDLKATNILIHNNNPYFIDFDGAVHHNTNFLLKRSFKKEIRRFMKNWQNNQVVKNMFLKEISENPFYIN